MQIDEHRKGAVAFGHDHVGREVARIDGTVEGTHLGQVSVQHAGEAVEQIAHLLHGRGRLRGEELAE